MKALEVMKAFQDAFEQALSTTAAGARLFDHLSALTSDSRADILRDMRECVKQAAANTSQHAADEEDA